MHGCDAVVHAPSVYSLDVRKAKTMRGVNVGGTETVLGVAERLGPDLIVRNPRGDDSEARAELGFAPRPVRETLADRSRRLHGAGHLARQAGKLAA